MALGLVLIVASLTGEVFDLLRLPRLTGYLLVGVLFGPSVFNLITPGMASQLRLVNGLAVALIAFGAGLELDLAHLRGRWSGLARHGGLLLSLVFSGLLLATLLVSPVLPFTATAPWRVRLAVAIVTASVMTAFSPTVVMAVLSETRARGPLSERILQLVVVGDLGVVLLFTGATAVAHLLSGAPVDLGDVCRHVAWEVIGSITIGAGAGLGFSAYRRAVNHRTALVLGALCLVVAEVGQRIGLSPLLCCLTAGCMTRNIGRREHDDMEELLDGIRLPVIVVFFAAAGATLHMHELAAFAPMALGLVATRAFLILGANRLAARRSDLPEHLPGLVPFGLISQAGVALGLAVIVGRDFPGWGGVLETVFVAAISMHEIAGPILFRSALVRAGEVPKSVEVAALEASA